MSDERRLYLFENGNPDWVVAYDEADANRVYCEHLGEDPATYDPGDDNDWERKADDSTAKYWIGPDGQLCEPSEPGAELTEIRAVEVVQRFGRGFCASVDF